MIIAIDGPSGSGKSTVSKLVAQKMDLVYIDTGAIYRTVGVIARRQRLDLKDNDAVGKLAQNFEITFKFINGVNHVYYKGEDVSEVIRTPEASMDASAVSSLPKVRDSLLGIQRNLGNSNDSILEGRDIGTVIFPNAEFKFFTSASNDVRAERRHKELLAKGTEISFEEVKEQIIQRDKQDSTRDVAPLKLADDGIEVDTSNMTIDDVVNYIIEYVKEHRK
jgi:cytidylate kinase